MDSTYDADSNAPPAKTKELFLETMMPPPSTRRTPPWMPSTPSCIPGWFPPPQARTDDMPECPVVSNHQGTKTSIPVLAESLPQRNTLHLPMRRLIDFFPDRIPSPQFPTNHQSKRLESSNFIELLELQSHGSRSPNTLERRKILLREWKAKKADEQRGGHGRAQKVAAQ